MACLLGVLSFAGQSASNAFGQTAGKSAPKVEWLESVADTTETSDYSEVETKSEPETYLDNDDSKPFIEDGGNSPLKPGYKIYFTNCRLLPYKLESTGKIGLCVNSDNLHFAFDPIFDDIYIENFAK